MDYISDFNCGSFEQEEKQGLYQYFKQQQSQHLRQPLQNPSVVATLAADNLTSGSCSDKESNENMIRFIGTPESSQTDSDELSPQIQRKRRSGQHQRVTLPRFSISIEDDDHIG